MFPLQAAALACAVHYMYERVVEDRAPCAKNMKQPQVLPQTQTLDGRYINVIDRERTDHSHLNRSTKKRRRQHPGGA